MLDALRRAHRRGARVASICAGAFILAAAGLLDGRRATTHWAHTEALSRRYPRVQVDANVLYVDDGDIMTSAGRAAGLDLCLHIVRSDHGTEIANHVARRLGHRAASRRGSGAVHPATGPQHRRRCAHRRICLGPAPSRSRSDDLNPC
jgi:transcriptional regulator GlxA family with amidase domain